MPKIWYDTLNDKLDLPRMPRPTNTIHVNGTAVRTGLDPESAKADLEHYLNGGDPDELENSYSTIHQLADQNGLLDRRRKKKQERNEWIAAQVEGGRSYAAVAQDAGLTSPTVAGICEEKGVRSPQSKRRAMRRELNPLRALSELSAKHYPLDVKRAAVKLSYRASPLTAAYIYQIDPVTARRWMETIRL